MQSPPSSGLRLQPLVHVEDMPSAVHFYELLGGHLEGGNRDGDWVLMHVADSQLALLAHPPNPNQDTGRVELNFVAEAPLEAVEARLREAGAALVESVSETNFGRQLLVKSPDGLLVKINVLDPQRIA